MSNLYKEIENLTIELVNIPSVNNTKGEVDLANKIYKYISQIDYFKENEDLIWKQPLKDDALGRMNIIALLKGNGNKSNKTIILHGHMDTVGVEDFGELAKYAFDPLTLEEKMKEMNLDTDVKKDLESGDWMFGRGSNDMKSGVAAHLVLLKELSKNRDKLNGNILFMSNPVEENQHTGIIESVEFLEKLKEKEELEYVVAINNDYTTALYPDDPSRYIYLGAVGKLLPCYYIVGKETHVGQCFEGLDPNLIASELVRLINLNSDLCDEYEGEFTLPPAALKVTDLKSSYNVQMPFASYVYFNYFVHDASVDEITNILLQKGKIAFENVIEYLSIQYKNYCEKVNQEYKPLKWEAKVTTFEELYNRVKIEIGDELDTIIYDITKGLKDQGCDTREIGLQVVKKVKQLSSENEPEVILYYSPPYCPHNTLKENKNPQLIKILEEVVDEVGKEENEDFKVMKFFPSLSDSSYLKIDDEEESIDTLIANFPSYKEIYNIPVKEIKKINIPAINLGCYGKDAHKSTERVYKPYSFGVLPKLLKATIDKILNTSL
ncbi:M20/M25/M40 family metallo-hydrolase [Clostridium sp. DL1XJH146]